MRREAYENHTNEKMYSKSSCEGIMRDKREYIDDQIDAIKNNYDQMEFDSIFEKSIFENTVVNPLISELKVLRARTYLLSFE